MPHLVQIQNLGPSSVGRSIIRTSAAGVPEYYAPGANGEALIIVGGIPTWSAMSDLVVAADAGANQNIILASEILSILGGTGIDTTTGANSVTIALNAALNDLNDVVIAAPTVGQNLAWDGANWVNQDPLQFGEYQTTFNASLGVFPGGAGIVAADWFNTTTAGIVDGQAFSIGDLLIAIVDTPSNVTFAGNWVRVSPIGSFSQFTISGDAGPAQTILNLDNVILQGGTNVTVTMSAPDTATFDWAAALDDLTNVNAGAPAVNDVLTWDGANWVDTAITALETTTTIAGTLGAGNTIGTYTNEDGVVVTLRETITTLAGTLGAGNTIGTYTNEAGAAVILRETTTTLAGTLGAGNTIGTYTNEAGAAVVVRETITDFLLSGSNLRFVDEAGVNNDVAISTLISTDGGNAIIVGGDGKLYVTAGAVVANLSLGPITGTTVDVLIDAGTDITLPAVTTTTAGVMTAAFLNDLLDLITLSGVAGNSINLGTFTGVTIPDNQTIKQALQALETDLELQNLRFDILDEGVDTGAGEITSINFVGAGVVATQAGNAVTVTIGGGTTYTASNVNVGGVGVYDGTVANDFQFKGINNGNAAISVTDDAGNNEIDVAVVRSPNAGQTLSIGTTGLGSIQAVDEFTNVADGSTSVNLTTTPLAGSLRFLYIDGVLQPQSEIVSVVGTLLTFSTATSSPVGGPANATDITVVYWIAAS